MKKILALVLAAIMMIAACSALAEQEAAAPELKLGQVVTWVHGHGFAVITVVLEGETIKLAKIDEFQLMGDREDIKVVGAPISKDGEVISQTNAETGAVSVLGSKRVNSDLYSANMQRAGSKVQIAANYDIIEKFVVGKTIEQLEKAVEVEGFADTITGATLADRVNYVKGIIEAAKAAHAQYAGTHGGNTGTYTLWNTTGEDIVGIYMTDLNSGWQSINYATAPLHTLGSENDNNPYIITRTVPEEEIDTHMRIWAETASGKIIEFPGESEHGANNGGLSIETTNIEFMNPDAVTGATQIGWFAPAK